MDRWACVNALSFPLQLLLIERPQWRDQPAAVVVDANPRSRVTHLNEAARQAGLEVGLRHQEALSLLPSLRAAAVDEQTIKEQTQEMASTLREMAPHIEGDEDRPGLFWLDVSGLEHLNESWESWARRLRERLRQEHRIYAVVVIGFRRFATYAIARAHRASGVFECPDRERRAVGSIALADLDLGPSTRRRLDRWGIATVDDLVALPPEGLRRRADKALLELYRRARGDLDAPLSTLKEDKPTQREHRLAHEVDDHHRLLFAIKRHLHPLLEELERQGETLEALDLALHREQGEPIQATLRPAEATLDASLLLELIRLRLDALSIDGAITDLTLTAHGQRHQSDQLHLFVEAAPRDLEAANHALAQVRSQFGAHTVQRMVFGDSHLPESRFDLTPLKTLKEPSPGVADPDELTLRPAIRRFYHPPRPVERPARHQFLAGPHDICGGWWIRTVHRQYHFVAIGHRLLWVFYDQRRQQWYLHAEF